MTISKGTWATASARDKIIAGVVFSVLALSLALWAFVAITGSDNGGDVTTTHGYCEGQWNEAVKNGATSGMDVDAIRQQRDNFIDNCKKAPTGLVKP